MCTHPLDLAKVFVAFQSRSRDASYADRQESKHAANVGAVSWSRRTAPTRLATHTDITLMYQTTGLRRGAYAGLSASILRQMTYSLTRFGVYDHLKQKLATPTEPTLPAWKMAVAASVAGGLGGIAGNPADIVLVRMTSDGNKPPEKQLKYRNCFDGLLRIVREEGPAALFRGVGPNVARAILMNASQLATYDVFKTGLLQTRWMEDGLPLHFTSSFLAGTVATTICAPFDVIKSRIMNASGNEGVVKVITKSFQREGFAWMFRGWTPAWIRLSPNTIIIFMTLEQLKRAIDYLRE
ncbi:hypothetical protein OIO90_006533 [Microbotryomycetes sp. JL221]|nr:hypothetical protein OIO90_006533 [Microbotryomycetes sp. JL221]